MLTAIAFERLLEELLYHILYADSEYNEIAILVEALMDAHEGRSRMLALFKKVAYGSFATEAAEVGFPHFAEKWQALVEERNRFIHGDRRPAASIKDYGNLHELGIEGLKVFMTLHNSYTRARL